MLDRADHDVTAALGAPALEHAAEGQVVGFGAGAGEDDLTLRAAEHRGDAIP